jgi:hypothetical protein
MAKKASCNFSIPAIILAIAYIAAMVLFLSWAAILLFIPIVVLLLLGGIATVKDLVRNKASRSFRTVFILLMILSILALLALTPGFDLLNHGMRFRLLITGGQDKLHSWAMEVLEMPPHDAEPGVEYSNWRIFKETWSKQVKVLRPDSVDIQTIDHSTGEKAVYLSYGGGFHHWFIILTQSKVDPDSLFGSDYGMSDQWREGIYVVQEM